MKRIRIILFVLANLLIWHVSGFGQAFFFVNEEKDYPSKEFAEEAKEHMTWYVNGVPVKYITGSYAIPVNQGNGFDTIIIQKTFYPHGVKPQKRKTPPDTTRKIVLCKLREKHNYKLRQILPGKFEIFSLDSFSARLAYRFSVVNKSTQDTLILFAPGLFMPRVYSDTVFQLIDGNEKLQQSFTVSFFLVREKVKGCFQYAPNIVRAKNRRDEIVFCEVSFLFLHGEFIEVEYDLSNGHYSIVTK